MLRFSLNPDIQRSLLRAEIFENQRQTFYLWLIFNVLPSTTTVKSIIPIYNPTIHPLTRKSSETEYNLKKNRRYKLIVLNSKTSILITSILIITILMTSIFMTSILMTSILMTSIMMTLKIQFWLTWNLNFDNINFDDFNFDDLITSIFMTLKLQFWWN